ncbi:hypothetical protein CWI35_02900 [[Bacillus] caldolyticus]|uniref:Uncharacterized protein n=1 Tax=Bacillus caldolyticus TaxID=1394 RepID=A0ABM6QJS1_BACCL|nr:hypothetical protein CWI35_02900 [[Bacillus] caldolyticus]
MLFSTALRLVAPTSVANKSSQPSSGIISECHPQIFYSHGGVLAAHLMLDDIEKYFLQRQ